MSDSVIHYIDFYVYMDIYIFLYTTEMKLNKIVLALLICDVFFFLAALGLRCCAQAFSSCGERGYSSLQCAGFSLLWPLLLWSMGSRCTGFSSCSTWAQ